MSDQVAHSLIFHGDGELASCVVCRAAEGELLTWCPGYPLNAETLEACYTGNVIDMKWHPAARRRRRSQKGER